MAIYWTLALRCDTCDTVSAVQVPADPYQYSRPLRRLRDLAARMGWTAKLGGRHVDRCPRCSL
jgi:hypothetical protein